MFAPPAVLGFDGPPAVLIRPKRYFKIAGATEEVTAVSERYLAILKNLVEDFASSHPT